METLPNMDVEDMAVGDLICTLREARLPPATIEKALKCAAWICDVRSFKFESLVMGEYGSFLEGTIDAPTAFNRILVRLRVPDPAPHVTDDEAELMRKFRAAGYSIREICAIFDRSSETVHRLTADVEDFAKQTPSTVLAL